MVATKYGRSGKPHTIVLRLTHDEQTLMWETHGLAKLKKKAKKRWVEKLMHACHGWVAFKEGQVVLFRLARFL